MILQFPNPVNLKFQVDLTICVIGRRLIAGGAFLFSRIFSEIGESKERLEPKPIDEMR